MDKKILEQIKKDLILEKERIIKDLKMIAQKNIHEHDDHSASFPQFGDKPDENAMEVGEYTTNLATEKILEDGLRDVEAALKRIEDGTYGICKYCKKEIDPKRLLARPVASACIECKTKLQRL